MKNIKTIVFILVVSLLSIIFNPIFSDATTYSVTDESTLTEAVSSAKDGDVITLSNSISLTKPLEIKEKIITINGNNHTISKSDDTFTPNGANATLITAGQKSTVTLTNLTLEKSQKYGAQSYDGGYLILDNVTIQDCEYGGVLLNAGTGEIRNLNLKHNGREDSNNGIEIGKSAAISDSPNDPLLKMNGTLTSTETENVIFVAINDKLADFDVVNDENTTNKVFLNGNQIVVTDANNNILYTSNEIDEDKINVEGTTFAKNIYINVQLMNKTIAITSQEGNEITEETIRSQINLEALELNNYTIEGFYLDNGFTNKVEFPKTFAEDTTIYAKLNLIKAEVETETEAEKDTTPKTGSQNTLSIALFSIAISIIAISTLKRKEV